MHRYCMGQPTTGVRLETNRNVNHYGSFHKAAAGSRVSVCLWLTLLTAFTTTLHHDSQWTITRNVKPLCLRIADVCHLLITSLYGSGRKYVANSLVLWPKSTVHISVTESITWLRDKISALGTWSLFPVLGFSYAVCSWNCALWTWRPHIPRFTFTRDTCSRCHVIHVSPSSDLSSGWSRDRSVNQITCRHASFR